MGHSEDSLLFDLVYLTRRPGASQKLLLLTPGLGSSCNNQYDFKNGCLCLWTTPRWRDLPFIFIFSFYPMCFVNGGEGWQCNFWLLVLKEDITWVGKVIFCCSIFRSWQLLRYERADIIFKAPILFYTDTSHILMKNKVCYGDVVYSIQFLYPEVFGSYLNVYVLCLLTDYILIEVGEFVFWAHRYPLESRTMVAFYVMDP